MTGFFLEISLQQSDGSCRYSFCFPSVAIMAERRNVLQEDDILCELYTDRSSYVSDFSDSKSLDSVVERDSDIPTSSRKQLRYSVIVVTSERETSAISRQFL